MIALLKRNPLITALAVLTAALVAVVAVEYSSGSKLSQRAAGASARRAAVVDTKLLPQVAAVNPDSEYAETTARPLFTPTRRPAPAQAVAANSTAMVKGQFTLTGVTIAGDTKIALLREKSSGRVVRVEQGKEVNGVTVANIEPDRVTLAQGGDQEVVGMLVAKAGPAVPAPAAATPAGPFAPASAAPGAGLPVGVNPAARIAPTVAPGQPPTPPVNPNTLFGPRPGGLINPNAVPDPTQTAPNAAPMTPEEILARRRARRNQQTQ
jgi:hypothetical protein